MTDLDMSMGTTSSLNDNSQTIVLVFFKDAGAEVWESDTRNFDRVPTAGEYLTMSRDGDWYEVKAVVHMAFPLDYDAEIYCVKVDDKFALRRSFGE